MDRIRYQRISELFERASELPDAHRAAWVRAEAGLEVELADTVLRMLSHDAADQLLDRPLDRLVVALIDAPSEQEPTLGVGDRVGDYEILGILGRGGMGVVYRARDSRLDRLAALKFLPTSGAGAAAVASIEAEARAASGLDHPNIATIYHVGAAGDGRPYMAMAYYEGQTLAERLVAGPLDTAEAVRIAAAIAAGLAAAHGRGIVHRDVKPANVFLTSGGGVKLLDFGIAAAAYHALGGSARGTLRYMSPEQAEAARPNPRSDVWSLGAVLYEMLTGKPPFEGDSPERIGVPAGLRAVLNRALARAPEQRYPDAGAMLADLARLLRPRFRRAAAVLALTALGVLSLWIATRSGSADTAAGVAAHIEHGNLLLAKRTPEAVGQAIAEYEAALTLDSTDATALAKAGYGYIMVVDWGWSFRGLGTPTLRARATHLSQRAMARDSGSAAAWLTRAYLLTVDDPYHLRGAVEAFARALTLDSTTAEGWYQFGQALQILGRFDEAGRAYRRAFKLDPNRPMAYMSLSAISLRRGRVAEARALIDSAIAASRNETSPYVRVARGGTALADGDLRVAHDEAELALAMDSVFSIPARSLLARVYVAEGNRTGAAEQIERARSQLGGGDPGTTAVRFLASALVAFGNREEALDLIERARPRGATLWFYLLSQEFDPIRKEPRFQKVFREADPNLP